MAVLLFVGPTGVGKTELAKALAEHLFWGPSASSFFRIDMGAYKAKGDISTLIGSPKGYEDSREGGVLTSFFQRQQRSLAGGRSGGAVVLLDEVEKAHGEVLDLFLPAFDEGYLT